MYEQAPCQLRRSPDSESVPNRDELRNQVAAGMMPREPTLIFLNEELAFSPPNSTALHLALTSDVTFGAVGGASTLTSCTRSILLGHLGQQTPQIATCVISGASCAMIGRPAPLGYFWGVVQQAFTVCFHVIRRQRHQCRRSHIPGLGTCLDCDMRSRMARTDDERDSATRCTIASINVRRSVPDNA